MAFCNQCGSKLPDGAKFCPSCGAANDASDPSDTVATTGPAPAYSSSVPPASSAPLPGSHAPASAPARGGIGLVLPIMVLLAVVVIGYLLLAGRNPNRGDAPQQSAATTSGPAATTTTAGGNDTAQRSVDAASDAATVAAARAADTANYASAATIDSAFHDDPAAASLRYPGAVRVSGVIASMVEPGPTPSLSMEGRTRLNFMVVNFPAGYGERLAPLYKGQFISVACDGARSLAGTTILSGCVLI